MFGIKKESVGVSQQGQTVELLAAVIQEMTTCRRKEKGERTGFGFLDPA